MTAGIPSILPLPKINPNDWVECINPYHPRYGECGKVTATQTNIFKDPSYPHESRVMFGDTHTFWINNQFLIIRHKDQMNIPGDEL